MVRQWAATGVDLNGIQKNLAAECGVHMTYMDVRFLLLDHGIEIAVPSAAPAPEPKAADTWDCPQCGAKGITAKFCGECGCRKPEAPASWDCPECGNKGVTAKFCPECGHKKEQ